MAAMAATTANSCGCCLHVQAFTHFDLPRLRRSSISSLKASQFDVLRLWLSSGMRPSPLPGQRQRLRGRCRLEASSDQPPSSREEAVQQAGASLFALLENSLKKQGPAIVKQRKDQRQLRLRIEIPELDESPASIVALSLDLLSAFTSGKREPVTDIAVYLTDFSMVELAINKHAPSGSVPRLHFFSLEEAWTVHQECSCVFVVAPRLLHASVIANIGTEAGFRPMVVLNPDWSSEEESNGRWKGLLFSFQVAYSFTPICIQGMSRKTEGAILKHVKSGAPSGRPWLIFVKDSDEFKCVSRLKSRPEAAELEAALCNFVAPNSPITKSISPDWQEVPTYFRGSELQNKFTRILEDKLKVGCPCGHQLQLFEGNRLLDMYVKFKRMGDARHVFDKMPQRNVISWNVMILGYAKKEEGEVALGLYVQMQQQGVKPNERTFVGALKACSSLAGLEEGKKVDGQLVRMGCLQKGRTIHMQVVKGGFESNAFVGNTLMDMYVKCGSMVDAQHVFDKSHHCDAVAWNVMILGHAEREESELALQLYAQMINEGFTPDDRTLVGALKACSSLIALEYGTESAGKRVKLCSLEKGRAIHFQVVNKGFESDTFVGNTLVDMYAKCGGMVDARHVFDRLLHRNVVSWNAMILGYVNKHEGEVALQLYAVMLEEGIVPDDRTFVGVFKACSSLATLEEGSEIEGQYLKVGCLEKGRAIHSHVVRGCFVFNMFMETSLVDMYAKCGSMVEARHVFDKMVHRDVVSWNAIIWGYAEQGESEEALKLYAQMQEKGLVADSWTFVSIVKACGDTAALETGKNIHSQICRLGIEMSEVVAASLIDMYGKCGSMDIAQQVFDALGTKDRMTWNALIAGYARQGEGEVVIDLFERMKQEGIQADGMTFLFVLTACSCVGLVNEGRKYFEAMSKDCGVTPTLEHYTCMVDLLGRAGQVEEAMAMVKKMPFQPDVVVWRSVLGACRKWKNVDVGRLAFQCAMKLGEEHSSAYMLMSNIYADADMWKESEKVQAMRKKAGAWKTPGQSWWTDTDGIVHTFVVGDARHPQSKVIYAKLKDLTVRMKESEENVLRVRVMGQLR